MIINETVSSPVLSNVLSAPSRFKIKASAKAFKILSGFYSEPILAIPRELGANAWDSHVKSGNTKQMFEVHAPNTLEPWFSIRDFGTGLSPEAIDTIYTTYFESTKTADNDSDGCMGLGSKTPFNYTENFTVTSWYGGKKHVYNCFIDESGSPNIMHLASEYSDEHSGLEVKFAVKIADISMWVDKIYRAYEPFRFRPTIKGAKIEFKPRDYIYSGKNWAMRNSTNDYYNGRGANAFMGNYCYPINTQAVRSAIINSGKKININVENVLHYGSFDLFFNIGDLEVAPNKEQLQYSDNNQTVDAIVDALVHAVAELKELVYKSIEKPKSRWEAMSLYSKYNGYNSNYSHIRNIIGDITINYNGTHLGSNSENILTVHKSCGATSPDKSLNLTSTFEVYTLDGIGARMRKTSAYYPRPSGKTLFFYTSSSSVKNARLRHYLKTNYSNKEFPFCYIISDQSSNTENFFKHMKYFGWETGQVINIDALPRPPATPRSKKTVNSNDVFTITLSDVKDRGDLFWSHKPCTVNGSGTYYYVDFLYNSPMWNGKPVEDNMSSIVNYFISKKLDSNVTQIFGINAKNKHLIRVGNWINIVDLVKQHIEKNSKDAEDLLYKHSMIQAFMSEASLYNILLRNKHLFNMIDADSTKNMLQDFVNTYAKIYATNNSVGDVKMYTFMGFKSKQHTSLGFDIIKFSDILEKKYMGIFGMMRDVYSFDAKKMSTLINFIDANTKS